MIETIGWIGSFLLSTCGFPLVYDVYKNKKVDGISVPFLWWWVVGEIFMLIYILAMETLSYPLLVNYLVNITCPLFVLWYIFKNKK